MTESAMMERNLVVLYGSQTGTAEDVAKRIRKQARLRRFNTSLMALNDFTVDRLVATPLIVFVCSTTGQGEEPDNMKVFWRAMLRRRLPPNSLPTLEFAVLGLGDSSYQNFNFTAKRLHRRLLKLGATAFHEMGLADDQHELGFDGVAEPWIKTIMHKLMQKFPLPDGQGMGEEGLSVSSYSVQFLSGTLEDETMNYPDIDTTKKSKDPPFSARLISNERETTEDHFQDVRLMKFDTTESELKHEPGDVLVVVPKNQPDAVAELLTFLDLDGQKCILLSVNDQDVSMPAAHLLRNPCTVEEAATRYWDFQGVPRRSFFELLLQFATDDREKERLREFASPEGTDDLYGYCFRPKRTAFEVLQDFSDTAKKIPFEYLFDVFPPVKPRSFSIASSAKYHKGEIHILVAVVSYKTKLKRPRVGLCSNWLASLRTDTRLPIWVKKGSMKFDKVRNKPVVMVGPGTGVAPFRAFIYDRVAQRTGNSILFFGCRNSGKDFFFEAEWKKLQQEGLLTLLPPAFSRDQPHKIYVQDAMTEFGALVFDSIHSQEGFFYVAGNSKNMPTDVGFALKTLLSHHGGMTLEEAEEYISGMTSDGRYQTETWS